MILKKGKKMLESLKGYRTLIAASLTALFGILATTDWIHFFDDPKTGLVAIGIALIMAGMRIVTTTPIFQKAKEEQGKLVDNK